MEIKLWHTSVAGNIIGELSFLSGELATADVKATEKGFCIFWNQKKLEELLKTDEKLYANFQLIFTKELAGKVAKGYY